MAKYKMLKVNVPNRSGKKIKYPRIKRTGRVSLVQIAEQISAASSFTPGDVMGVAAMLVDKIAEHIGEGAAVQVGTLGTFTVKLALRKGLDYEEEGGQRRNASSIVIGGVNFRPTKEMLRKVGRTCYLSREPNPKSKSEVMVTERPERLELALAYLREHRTMSISQYAALTGLSRTTAGLELRALNEEHLIGCEGRGTHKRYVLPSSQEAIPEE